MKKPTKKATKKTAALNEEQVVKETINEVLKVLTIEGEIDSAIEDETVSVSLETQDTGIVIGYHGEVLESLEVVLSACVSKKLGRFLRVSLEIGEYKKNRTDWLENLAKSSKEKVLSEQTEVSLPGLKSWERRIVHLLLQKDSEVVSESVGEGRERTLVIKPRS